MTKEVRKHSGEKTVCLTNSVGKTGQQMQKNETGTLYYMMHKNKLKIN